MSQFSESKGSSTKDGSNRFLVEGNTSEKGDARGEDMALGKGDVEIREGGRRGAAMEWEAAAVASSGSSTKARLSAFLGATRGEKGFE
jgi:hypothetical protein